MMHQRSATIQHTPCATTTTLPRHVRQQRPLCRAYGDRQPAEHQTATSQVSETTRRRILKLVATGLAAAGCPHCQALAGEEGTTWGYGGPIGPASWPPACQAGLQQSPINIPLSNLSSSGRSSSPSAPQHASIPLSFSYKHFQPAEVLLTEQGAIQVRTAPGNTCSVADQQLELLQFHFHTPSEHAVDGRRTAMEAHLVHRNTATGGLAVVGVLMERGAALPNSCLEYGLRHVPAEPGTVAVSQPVQVTDLLPRRRGGHLPFVHYRGSLTTPPCSEGVDWLVLTDTLKVPDEQVLRFMEQCAGGVGYGQNARPLQPLGAGRQLELEDAV